MLAAALGASGASAPIASSYRITVTPPGEPPTVLHVEEAGQGAPLLLLHGLGASTFTWRHIVPALARDHRVIALDLKGFGRSDKPFDARYSAADQAALVAAFIRKRGLTGVTLVGHSFGGTVVLQTVLDLDGEPERVARLVVIDAPALKQDFGDAAQLLRAPRLPQVAMTVAPPEVMARLLLRYVSAPGRDIPESDIRGYAAPFNDPASRHAFIATARAILDANGHGMDARYSAIRQPTLLIWCRRDRIVPLATARRLARRLANARLQILKQCNHLPQDEVPDALLARMRAFLTHGETRRVTPGP
jgi:pimeloyl-ACP methyl ester carboxylesterase